MSEKVSYTTGRKVHRSPKVAKFILGAFVGVLLAYLLFFLMNRMSPREYVLTGGSKLDRLMFLLENQYVDDLDVADLEEQVIEQFLKDLDPHSSYFSKESLEQAHEHLDESFGGIGIMFNLNKDTIFVVRVISGGPSERVGLRAGDRILEVDGKVYVGDSINNSGAMKLLKGPKGSKVEVGVMRQGIDELLRYEITRGDIPLHTVDVGYMMKDDIAYMRIDRFGLKTYEEFYNIMTRLEKEGMESLVLDLRGNGGGYMGAALRILGAFLAKGDTMLYTEGKFSPREDYVADGRGRFKDLPLVVLIDDWSASSSEIVAGALQDNDRALIMGRRSFGKGLVQQEFPLGDGTAVRLTISRYYIPSGRCVQKPYEDREGYQLDIYKRFEHGEFYDGDSVRVDSLQEYYTKSGRKVYGGGGIIPDVFIPQDTTLLSPFLNKLYIHAYPFALDFVDEFRNEFDQFKTVQEVSSFMKRKQVLVKFSAFVQKKGTTLVGNEFELHQERLLRRLLAYVCSNSLGEEAFFRVLEQDDIVIEAAVEEIKKGISLNRD